MMIGAAAVAVGASAATQIVTNTLDGVTCYPASDLRWQIKLDTEAKTVQLGLNQDGAPGGSWAGNSALALDDPSKVTVPMYFTCGGVDYNVTTIQDRAFLTDGAIGSPSLESITILENVTQINKRVFANSGIRDVLCKGPVTVASGAVQNYVTVGFGGDVNTPSWWPFAQIPNLKFFVVGPNMKTGGSRTRFGFPNSSGVTVLLPDRTDNTSWRKSAVDTTVNNVIFYGPDYDFDMTMAETAMTFYPKTETALTNIISWASTFKSAFDMDTKIAITNRIEMSEGVQITEAMLQNVTLEAPPWYLTFAVTNQAQLDNVLAAVSADVPIIIDIEGAGKNQITVPNGRKVAILAKSGWTFGKKLNGLIISFF